MEQIESLVINTLGYILLTVVMVIVQIIVGAVGLAAVVLFYTWPFIVVFGVALWATRLKRRH